MSMNLESELRMSLKAMMCDMQSPNPFKSLDEKKAIIERYVQDLLDMLQENYGKVPEQGERENGSERESYDAGFSNGVKACLQQLDGLIREGADVDEIQGWIDRQWEEEI